MALSDAGRTPVGVCTEHGKVLYFPLVFGCVSMTCDYQTTLLRKRCHRSLATALLLLVWCVMAQTPGTCVHREMYVDFPEKLDRLDIFHCI